MAERQLHEILAVAPARKGAAEKISNETIKTFTNKTHHFDATLRTYQPLSEDGKSEPDEFSPMVTTVGEKIRHFNDIFSDYVDVSFQIDDTNLNAKADIIIDDKVIASDVPATFLMQLEKRIIDIRSVYNNIPTLDPKYTWGPDSDKGNGVYKANDQVTHRTAKVRKSKILYEATEHHPAQIDQWIEEDRVGTYTSKRWSGALTPADKSAIIRRIDKLLAAVKQARMRANQTEHSKRKIADDLFDYINGDLPLNR